jgi:hypothetical protein
MTSSINQEAIFLNQEADAWFRRNAPSTLQPASYDDPILKALRQVKLPEQGILLDVGGAWGRIAEAFRREHPTWQCCVVEPSSAAISAGTQAFPEIKFYQGSIAQKEGLPCAPVDVAIVSGVFCWVDRNLLSYAISNVDIAIRDGGWLVIADFDSPFLRANPYKHFAGAYSYKQDYAQIFNSLGIYHTVYRFSENLVEHSASDNNDPYDRQWAITILKKDLQGRYFRPQL